MDHILEGLNGIVGIADDVGVYGQNDKDHDKNIHNLIIRATETGFQQWKMLHQTNQHILC